MSYEDLVSVAKNYSFVREQGANRGRWIDLFNQLAHVPMGSSYCASFVLHCLTEVFERSGQKHDLVFSPHVMSFYRSNVKAYRQKPMPGHIITWNHVGSDLGHCGIIVDVLDPASILTVEANTSPSSETVERDGEGVYLKTRKLVQVGDMKPNQFFLDPFWKPS